MANFGSSKCFVIPKKGQWPINLCLSNYEATLNFKYLQLIVEENGCICQMNYSFVIDDNQIESIKTILSSLPSILNSQRITFCFVSLPFFDFYSHLVTRCTQITALIRWQFTWISTKFDTNNTIAMAKWSHNQTAQWPNDKWCGYSYTKTDSHSIGWHLLSHQNNTQQPCQTIEHHSKNLVSNGPWTGKNTPSNDDILVGLPLLQLSVWFSLHSERSFCVCIWERKKESFVTLFTARFGQTI